jgi:hypothetical protein
MTLTGTPDQRRAQFRRLLMKRLGFSIPVRVPDEDDAGLPTAYCRQDRDFMNDQDDRAVTTRDTFRDRD